MKINLNHQFKNLAGKDFDRYVKDKNGKPTKEVIDMNEMGKCLAICMFHSNEKNLKFKIWSEQLYKTGILEIDDVDFELLIAWIEIYGTNDNIQFNTWFSQVGIKGQVIEMMKKQKK